MKKLTIAQKQAIYEHLLTLDCPDLLAALIAERTEHSAYNNVLESSTIDGVIWTAFVWSKSPEGYDFWKEVQDDILELENTVPAPQEHEDDFESPTEKDFAPKGREANIEIKVEAYRPPQPSEYVEWLEEQTKPRLTVTNYKAGDMIISDEGVLVCQAVTKTSPSFLDKVKLFFGKVFYKV
jgi:hypothetical protein